MTDFKFSNVNLTKLAKKYGTPLYVMSEDKIRERLNEIKDNFLDEHDNTMAVYASKAFLTKEMVRILKDTGIGMDAVSGGEIYTALSVEFPMGKIIFHGNNKSVSELELAIKNDVGKIVVDNLDEIEVVNKIAKDNNKTVNMLMRITPGIESDTHKYIQTAQVDSKFGIPLQENIIDDAMNLIKKSTNLSYKGLHFHIGSQLHSNDNHLKAIEIIMKLIDYIKNKHNIVTEELNTGGGYGIDYIGEGSKDLKYFTDNIMKKVKEQVAKYNMEVPKIIIEPGRWVVGEAGMTIYEVGFIKEIPGIRTYVGIDGGMTDNIRPSLYQAKYDAVVINKVDEDRDKVVTIAGKCCESGDILIEDLKVPSSIERGDFLGVLSTGAYNYSMASNYNKIPRPAVVFIKDGIDRLVVKRETYEDILSNQI